MLDNKHTRIHYSADIVPSFRIVPLIGSWNFQSKLPEEATHLIYNTEKIANSGRIADQFQYTQGQSTQKQKPPKTQTAKTTEDE